MLEKLFGENVTREALEDQVKFIEHLRSGQHLGVRSGEGLSAYPKTGQLRQTMAAQARCRKAR
jgi:hypothetical protein